jgi:fatty-acyl-CoA synthase
MGGAVTPTPTPMLAGLMQDRPLLVSSLIDYAAAWHGNREIVSRATEGHIHRTNYKAARERAMRVAAALLRHGIKPGDRIGTLAWNTHRHFELFYGISGIGAVLHTVNPRLFEEQIAYIVAHGGDRILFVDACFLPIVRRLLPQAPSVEAVVVLGRASAEERAGLDGLIDYEEWIAAVDPIADWPLLDERAACALCYTSGTTGEPKGVLYSHRSTVLHAFAAAQKSAMNIGCDDTIIAIAPMYHANAWGMAYIAAMTGAKLVLTGPRNDAENIVGLINGEGVTFACGVPTIWTAVLQHLRATGGSLPSLERTTIGGSAVSPGMIDALSAHGVRTLHLWGMTEMSPLGVVATKTSEVEAMGEADQRRQLTKQGRAQYGVELKIVDEEHRPLPHDGIAAGALWVRGPWIASAYFRREEEVLLDADGWFPTGDIATIDPLGYMQITDRAKDIIKSGGEWISSIELENVVAGHPDVAIAAVVGVPDPRWEERPLLVIQCAEDCAPDAAVIAAWLEGKVARWWIPERIEFVERMPLTATGKIRKTELREIYAAPAPATDTGDTRS